MGGWMNIALLGCDALTVESAARLGNTPCGVSVHPGDNPPMRILLLTHAYNSLTQCIDAALRAQGHDTSVEFDINDAVTEEAVTLYQPDLVSRAVVFGQGVQAFGAQQVVDVKFYRPVPDANESVPDTVPKVPDTGESVPDTAQKVPDTTGNVPDTGKKQPVSVSTRLRTILEHIEQHGPISAPDVAKLLSVKERRARAVLKYMLDYGLLVKRGSARQTVYVRLKA